MTGVSDRAVGEGLARLRVRAGLTQTEAAGRAGVSRISVWRWESGRHRLTLTDFIRLAETYGAPPGLALSVILGERRQVDLRGR
jgi:transcriptional regulator with XRE-family HTH domain